jgi:hypothetical protein
MGNRAAKRVAIVVGVFLALACGGETTALQNAVLSGRWVGTVGTQTLDISLAENGGAVTGSGTLTNTPSGTRAFTISGTYAAAPIGHTTITLSSGTAQPFTFAGQVYPSSMLGTLTGSGFTGDAITLTRQ